MQKLFWCRDIAHGFLRGGGGGDQWARRCPAPVRRQPRPPRESERVGRVRVGVSGGVRRRCPEDGVALRAARDAELDARGRSERQLGAGAPRRAPPAALGAPAQGRPGVGQPLHHR